MTSSWLKDMWQMLFLEGLILHQDEDYDVYVHMTVFNCENFCVLFGHKL